MAERIRLTPEGLNEAAGNLANGKADNESIINECSGLVTGLLGAWHGEAQDAFVTSFNQKKATFEEFTRDMDIFINFLKRTANDFETVEKQGVKEAINLGV